MTDECQRHITCFMQHWLCVPKPNSSSSRSWLRSHTINRPTDQPTNCDMQMTFLLKVILVQLVVRSIPSWWWYQSRAIAASWPSITTADLSQFFFFFWSRMDFNLCSCEQEIKLKEISAHVHKWDGIEAHQLAQPSQLSQKEEAPREACGSYGTRPTTRRCEWA